MVIKVCARSIKMSDKKIRVVASEIVGKRINEILLTLPMQKVKAAEILYKIIVFAIANISSKSINTNKLFIKSISVDKAKFIKKIFPRSQGRINYIKKKYSHIIVSLDSI